MSRHVVSAVTWQREYSGLASVVEENKESSGFKVNWFQLSYDAKN